MKKFFLTVLAIVLIHALVVAEIKNGYAANINETKLLVSHLKETLAENRNLNSKSVEKLKNRQIKKMKLKIDSLEYFIFYYELTKELLTQFKVIAPDLYNEIDGIENDNDKQTDVYVKFVHAEHMNMGQNAYTVMYQ